ncbi:syntenin-2 [Accipiter gentilis]|uniref:syntenin-2 n=1 Tax=Astur gentilis TaxID=8957 RepID=UPI002110B7E1|nr:syntenin-2 [Accipiter gentilis]XP_049673433.1 syntenin-2 [Accipiter gentilis]
MATLYPSLEDMKGHQILQAQAAAGVRTPATTVLTEKPKLVSDTAPPMLYPNLAELENYMGLALSSEEIQKNLLPESSTALTPAGPPPGQLVAPLTGNNAGLRRAEIKPGVREIHLCKDERGKTGLQLKNVDQGIFVQLVKVNSPAALVGLRFGDQILQIDGKNCTGWSSDKAQRALKKASPEKIVMVVRDRPFQRTVTLHKDSNGHIGIVVKKGKIVSLAKDSSAARNGLLTHHCICEVNGQNVIGMKDKQLTEVLAGAGNVVTLTIIPTVIYEHMVKRLSAGLVKSAMDHSVPDL